jgi:hypothetical protein
MLSYHQFWSFQINTQLSPIQLPSGRSSSKKLDYCKLSRRERERLRISDQNFVFRLGYNSYATWVPAAEM